jgi:hypothetical protein
MSAPRQFASEFSVFFSSDEMSMANWPKFIQSVRVMCDNRADRSIVLTIEEILKGARSSDKNVDKRWWWDLMSDPNASSHKGVLEIGMDCEPLPASGLIEHVVFRVRS